MSTDDSSQPQTIPLDDLSIEQLSQLQKQIDQELSFFTESVNELKGVETRFVESYEAVRGLESTAPDATALIPLSESVRHLMSVIRPLPWQMYVSATLVDAHKVLVEIGTGYFVEMTREKACDYFTRKQRYLLTQIATIDNILPEKQRTRAVIVEALQTKVQAAYRTQAGTGAP